MRKLQSTTAVGVSLLLASCGAQHLEMTCTTKKSPTSLKIVGGTFPDATSAIARATVGFDTMRGGLCTGTLVASNLIVTAAHCIKDTQAKNIYFGTSFKNSVVIQATASYGHPNYNLSYSYADIGWIKFEGKIPAGYAPLPVLTDAQSLQIGMKTTLVGFGVTGSDNKDAGTKRMIEVDLLKVVTQQSGFANVVVVGKGACFGDSGGPNYVKYKDSWAVVGATSGPNMGLANYNPADPCNSGGTVYTHISPFRSWIESTSGMKMLDESYLDSAPVTSPEPRNSSEDAVADTSKDSPVVGEVAQVETMDCFE